jgi:rubredoxin
MKQNGKFVKGKKLPVSTANFGNKFNIIYECPKGHIWHVPIADWHDISLSWMCPKCEEKGEHIHGNEFAVKVKGNVVEFDFQCPRCGYKWVNKKELYRLIRPISNVK